MYRRAWLARYSDSTCADHSVVLPWWCSASTVAPSAMPRLHDGKESTCLAFFLHLCSHGLLGGGTEGPQFLCKSNVNGGKVDEYKIYLVLPDYDAREASGSDLLLCAVEPFLSSSWNCFLLAFFIGKTRLRWGMSRAQPFCQIPWAQHSSHCSRVQEREMLASSPISPSWLCQVVFCAQLGSSCRLLLC